MNQEDLAIIDTALQPSPEGEEPEPDKREKDEEDDELLPKPPIPQSTNWRDLLRGASVQLEKLPDPGGIVFPLVILFLFFLILIPINGHTRLTWMWLVLTGNASIGQGNGSGSSAQDVNQPIVAPMPVLPSSHVGGF